MSGKIKMGLCIDFSTMDEMIPWAAEQGCESVSITGKAPLRMENLWETAARVRALTDKYGLSVSSIGVYGNPLAIDEDYLELKNLIASAYLFNTGIVSTFAGAIPGQSVEQSIPVFRERFSYLSHFAEDKGVKIAFENCLQGGSWDHATTNIAFNGRAWEMMKEAVPCDALGLEWEPAHQLAQLADPIVQLNRWADDIFHVHGKDAVIDWNAIRTEGIFGKRYIAQFCNPGNGDSNWTNIVSILKKHNYSGSISLERGHDPVWNGDLQEEGDQRAIAYIAKAIRLG